MTAALKVKANKIPTVRRKCTTNVIRVPRGELSPTTQRSNEVRKIQRILTSGKTSDSIIYQIPEDGDDVVMRIVRMSACTLSDDGDIPDFDDVNVTNLPWVGKITMNKATKAFTSKYSVFSEVRVVRESGGFLYLMEVGFIPKFADEIPHLHVVKEVSKGPMSTYDEIRIENYPLNDGLALQEFENAPRIPVGLVAELESLGYEYDDADDTFYVNECAYSSIKIKLWGKLIRG